jgi:nucleoid-associated protein YgaU
LAEQAQRQAAEAKRLQEAREAADKAAQKAAEEASRKAAAENAHKTAEQANIPQQQQQPPPAPQPAAKPEDSARLAEEMRQERARLEAEANDIEAQRKAAEAKRSADERAQDEARVAEDRRRAAAADSDKNRTRKIVLSTEPIPRADRRSVDAVRQPPPELRGVYRAPTNVSAAGPVVRRWIWRAGNSRCSRAGRRVMLPGRYTVRAGDSLWRISRRHYHSGLLYAKIYRANRSVLRNPDLIYPCQSIFVPRRH